MNGHLETLRREIDRIDSALAPLLEERMRLSDEIGAYKQKNGIPVRDEAREEALLVRIRALVESDCADSVESVYRAMLAASRARQNGEETE